MEREVTATRTFVSRARCLEKWRNEQNDPNRCGKGRLHISTTFFDSYVHAACSGGAPWRWRNSRFLSFRRVEGRGEHVAILARWRSRRWRHAARRSCLAPAVGCWPVAASARAYFAATPRRQLRPAARQSRRRGKRSLDAGCCGDGSASAWAGAPEHSLRRRPRAPKTPAGEGSPRRRPSAFGEGRAAARRLASGSARAAGP